MKADTLTLPQGTSAIVVDPLNDFLDPEGVFANTYGMQDTEPIRDVLPELQQMIGAWQENARIILCRSLYRRNQFGVPGLEELCVWDRPSGRFSPIPLEKFAVEFTKLDNSILSTRNDSILRMLESSRQIILTGLTVTSCIKKSIEQIGREVERLQVIVPRNATAARANEKSTTEADELFQQWSEPKNSRVIVVDRWQDIEFVKGDTTTTAS
jgi:nicotinamidase-related amidase